MKSKIKHYCKYSKETLLLTPMEHRIAHDIEATMFTPYFYQVNKSILRTIKTCKKDLHFIEAWRVKRLLKYYKNVIEDEKIKIFQLGEKLRLYLGRGNGKSIFATNFYLEAEYRNLKKQHKYIKAYKVKYLIKKYNREIQNVKK